MADEQDRVPGDEKATCVRPLWTARASFLFALVGVVFLPALSMDGKEVLFAIILLSVVFGVLTALDVRRKPHPRSDEWLAMAGITISLVVGFLMSGGPHCPGRISDRCFNRLSLLGMAACLYADAHDDCLPPTQHWEDDLRIYVRQISQGASHLEAERCSATRTKEQAPFAMNARVDGAYLAHVRYPAQTVLFFESVPGRNLSGGPELLPPKPRHQDGYLVEFVDGHRRTVPKSEIDKLNWEPKPAKSPSL